MRLLHCATPMIALAVASDGQAGCAVERKSSGAGHAGENGRLDEGTSRAWGRQQPERQKVLRRCSPTTPAFVWLEAHCVAPERRPRAGEKPAGTGSGEMALIALRGNNPR
jgi:hypothetical protein